MHVSLSEQPVLHEITCAVGVCADADKHTRPSPHVMSTLGGVRRGTHTKVKLGAICASGLVMTQSLVCPLFSHPFDFTATFPPTPWLYLQYKWFKISQ